MRKCKLCSREIGNKFIYCGTCRKIKEQERYEKKKKQQREKPKTPKPIAYHPCETPDCDAMVLGRRRFCDVHRRLRKLESQKRYDATKIRPTPEPDPLTPTSMEWLEKFKPWMNSGLPYETWRQLHAAETRQGF